MLGVRKMIDLLHQLFDYDAWASREVLASFRVATNLPPKAIKLLGHILSAEQLWYERIQGDPQSLPVWPDFTLQQCESQAQQVAILWKDFLSSLDPAALSRPVSYKNSKGEAWDSTVRDILLHVITHSAHHRGQIAAEMRTAGNTPAYTDFIHAVRNRFIE